MMTNDEIERLDYDKLAKLIVGRSENENELLAAIADALEKVAMWADGNARKEMKP